ncbi:retrovirus-related Pol polyprotein from transposon 17.6 [Trichonephila clavipes]|uniref:Retrovirus-related Pol polyprotein from transposon 17.6 n=1 Tax=Trichonephila clavipes TaxID=2585209 RepID=A0A8X6SAG9_TRICX|nr:retrovirus-related Pol polyprotein from transposon 17.6 [Trichonephila clavipes]
MNIILKDDIPVCQRARRLSCSEKLQVDDQIDDWLQQGHIIEKGTIKPSLDKTKAVQNFPEPKNVKQVQSFLGLSGYFRKFIQNYSIIAKPLSDLLRDNAVFHFGPEQQLAFQTLRQKLSENPVLHIFKQGAKLELHTDASKFGYGAILLQQ